MQLMDTDSAGSGRVSVWRCIGCGRIEGPQPCIGVCEDRKVELVEGAVHDEVVAQLGRLREQMRALTRVLRQLAHTTPRDGECERTYRALQAQARQALAALASAELLADSRRP
jgi:hypothetical protein